MAQIQQESYSMLAIRCTLECPMRHLWKLQRLPLTSSTRGLSSTPIRCTKESFRTAF
jgi:hypothetical protein